jgi:type III secretory pathway component EscS
MLSRYSDWLRSGDRIPVGARFFTHVQTGPGAHPVSCCRDHPPPSSAEVKSVELHVYLYTPPGGGGGTFESVTWYLYLYWPTIFIKDIIAKLYMLLSSLLQSSTVLQEQIIKCCSQSLVTVSMWPTMMKYWMTTDWVVYKNYDRHKSTSTLPRN